MKTVLRCAALASLLLACPLMARTVDDSYTIASRFERYRSLYPGIAWPAVAPAPGETMLFDRAYKPCRIVNFISISSAPRPIMPGIKGWCWCMAERGAQAARRISMCWRIVWRSAVIRCFCPNTASRPRRLFPPG
jgi:hypothetical protein